MNQLVDRLQRHLFGSQYKVLSAGLRATYSWMFLLLLPVGAGYGWFVAQLVVGTPSQFTTFSTAGMMAAATGAFWVSRGRAIAARRAGRIVELDRITERVRHSEDTELRGVVAEYAEDEVAALFDNASRTQTTGGWAAIAFGIVALIAAATVVWALIIDNDQSQTTADALARLAITIPAVYAAGILFKRGGAMQDQGTRLKAAGVAIRAVPLIA